jgi:hypothetical protein
MTDKTIETLYGGEFAAQLVSARIPFRVEYDENSNIFYIAEEHIELAFEMMGMIRRTKLR